MITEYSASIYSIPFDEGLRGAFQKTRGLNHFQPVVVLSGKRRFPTSPRQHFADIPLYSYYITKTQFC
jgi:hypothetical protein